MKIWRLIRNIHVLSGVRETIINRNTLTPLTLLPKLLEMWRDPVELNCQIVKGFLYMFECKCHVSHVRPNFGGNLVKIEVGLKYSQSR